MWGVDKSAWGYDKFCHIKSCKYNTQSWHVDIRMSPDDIYKNLKGWHIIWSEKVKVMKFLASQHKDLASQHKVPTSQQVAKLTWQSYHPGQVRDIKFSKSSTLYILTSLCRDWFVESSVKGMLT